MITLLYMQIVGDNAYIMQDKCVMCIISYIKFMF